MSDGYEAEDEWREEVAKAAVADTSRTRKAVNPFGTGQPEPQVDVPCRECGVTVRLSRWAYEQAKGPASEYLMRKGEPPIEDGEIARCRACHSKWLEKRRKEGEEWDAKVGQLVRETKQGRKLEAHELQWLRKHGYSETAQTLEEMVKRMAEAKAKQSKSRARGSL